MAVDVVVVGAGVMGSATACSLARAGRSVVLLEQFELGHTRGSSHGRSRIFRFSYPDPIYVEMAIEAEGMWRELERGAHHLGELLIEVGGLDAGPHIEANATAMEKLGVRFEFFTGKEASERFPQLSFQPELPLLWQPDGGIIAADKAIESFRWTAQQKGAVIREGARVTGLAPTHDKVLVELPGETIETSVVVVTAGAWVRDLVDPVGIDIPVRPTRETIAYFKTGSEVSPTVVEWGEPAIYAQPSPGHDGIKVGEHIAGPTADPNLPGGPDETSVARLKEWVAKRFRDAEPEPFLVDSCFYTNTSDEHFIVERHGRVVVGSPCSGHGFKFAPLTGNRLATLAEEVL